MELTPRDSMDTLPPTCISPRPLESRCYIVRPQNPRRSLPILQILSDATQRAQRYLNGLPGRPVFPSPSAVGALNDFAATLQARPIEPAQVLHELDVIRSPATVASAGGRYFGFVTGGSLSAVARTAEEDDPAADATSDSPGWTAVEKSKKREACRRPTATGRGGTASGQSPRCTAARCCCSRLGRCDAAAMRADNTRSAFRARQTRSR